MKNILITGANGNLGQACTQRFRAAGYQIIAIVSPGKKHTQPPEIFTYEADLTNEQTITDIINSIYQQHRTIDAALLLAGGYTWGPLSETSISTIKKMLSVNFETTFPCAQKVFEKMSSQPGGGRIVMIGARPSLVANEAKKNVAYALSKSLIFKLAEILNAAGKEKNIVTSVIVPSIIDTPVNRKDMPDADFSKWVTPEQIADTIHFIVSQSALREPIIKLYGGA